MLGDTAIINRAIDEAQGGRRRLELGSASKETVMWPQVSLLLREFARRPTVDRPERVDPALHVANRRLLQQWPARSPSLQGPRLDSRGARGGRADAPLRAK